MVEIKNIEVFNLDRATIAAGNPMSIGEIDTLRPITEQDKKRFFNLGRAASGSGHDNFLSGILVTFDIKYPQYWTPEFQRYHFAQIISSQSKMHRLILAATNEEFKSMFNKYVDEDAINRVQLYVEAYNYAVRSNDTEDKKYHFFMKALSNLPTGYEMWMTVTTNYLQLKSIYKQRKTHKLKEDWGSFCSMVENLPLFKELIR